MQWGSKPHITHGKGAILPLSVPCHRAIEVGAANPYRHIGDHPEKDEPPRSPSHEERKLPWGAGPGVQTPPVRRESVQAALRPPRVASDPWGSPLTTTRWQPARGCRIGP